MNIVYKITTQYNLYLLRSLVACTTLLIYTSGKHIPTHFLNEFGLLFRVLLLLNCPLKNVG